VKTPRQLMEIYYQSVGRVSSLLLNLPPDRRGLIHEIDAANLSEFHSLVEQTFSQDFASGASVSASSTHSPVDSPAHLVDGDPETCWAAAEGVQRAEITLELPKPATFDVFQAAETIRLGQRVRSWRLEALVEGAWKPFASGTTIGSKRLARFTPVTASRVRLLLTDCAANPILTSVGLFKEA